MNTSDASLQSLPASGRLLGLDVGDTTIGLALSDVSRMIATPLLTIERKKFAYDMQQMKQVIEKHNIAALVVGYPVNMDGSLGRRAQSTRSFVKEMQKHVTLPMIFWDERMSTMAAERVMLDADMSRERRAELVDKLAASYMLQGALDRLVNL